MGTTLRPDADEAEHLREVAEVLSRCLDVQVALTEALLRANGPTPALVARMARIDQARAHLDEERRRLDDHSGA